ncbi:uncharacterized protein LOC135693444 [Rhopilema esculentum]|uniref:uncharacterized protein LOC135693444 n=1 Tax=Rhopilema esculentum TaxID=499914 RepID=UPI0031D423ED
MTALQNCFMVPIVALIFLIEVSTCGYIDDMKKFPCYSRKFQLKRFYCENEFFVSFRAKPFQSCSDKAKELLKCFTTVDGECLAQADSSSMIYKIYTKLNKVQTHHTIKKDYCHNAGLVTPFLGARARRNLGCTLDYYIGKATCITDFQRKWRHNRSNRLLCNEYYVMKKCVRTELDAHCSQQAVQRMRAYKEKVISKLYPELNPFCIHKHKLF